MCYGIVSPLTPVARATKFYIKVQSIYVNTPYSQTLTNASARKRGYRMRGSYIHGIIKYINKSYEKN